VSIDRVLEIARESIETKRSFFDSRAEDVVLASKLISDSIMNGGKLLIIGNGGSAADAQHIAAELVNRLSRDRPPIPAIALTTDTSILTSIGNDSSYDEVFERQIKALGRPGDVVLAISTSGNSPNILKAASAARDLDMKIVALAGRDGGNLAARADVALVVPGESTQRIQETHITIGHIICELVEEALHGSAI
jgi:D-sedoheptulose 7-phosphate isomerase